MSWVGLLPLKPDQLNYLILNSAETVLIPNAQFILHNRGPGCSFISDP